MGHIQFVQTVSKSFKSKDNSVNAINIRSTNVVLSFLAPNFLLSKDPDYFNPKTARHSHWPYVDSVDQDQNAQNVQSDLGSTLSNCPISGYPPPHKIPMIIRFANILKVNFTYIAD